MCEFAASTLMSAFHSHQATQLKIQQVESEIAEQKAARERLETVAQRVDEAENELAEERQARKQLEAKVRLTKTDCLRLAERLCKLGDSQALPARTASLEEALACCDTAVARVEAVADDDRQALKNMEAEKNEASAKKEREINGLLAEIMKLRADLAHEKKLRDAMVESMGSSRISPAHSPRPSLPDNASGDSDRLLYVPTGAPSPSPAPGVPPQVRTGSTPPRMNSVHENECLSEQSFPSESLPPSAQGSNSDFSTAIPSTPSWRGGQCKSNCAIS